MGDETKELLIRVSATTELLRSQLTAAERTIEGFSRTAETANQRVNRAFQQGAVSTGQMRFAMRDLSMQIGDMATQFSLGARPMQIFASQGSQVAGAIGLMAGEATAIGRFLGGPWFQVLTAATLVLGPWISGLFNSADAAKTAADEVYGLKQALADIANMKPMEALGRLGNRVQEAQSKLRTAQAMPGVNRGGAIARATAVQAAQEELQNAQMEFKVAQLRARDVAVATAAESRRSRGGVSRVSRGSSAGDPFARNDPTVFRSLPGAIEQQLAEAGQRGIDRIREAWTGSSNDFRSELMHDQMERAAKIYEDAQKRADDRLTTMREAQLRSITGLYESLFRGGTKAIWDDFGRIGEQVVARVLGKFTLSLFDKKDGGFNLGGAILTAFSSVLGFADGGRPPLGRVSVVGERGPELFVPDAAGTIIPNHALGGSGVSIVINAPGATAETISMIRREISNAAPLIAAAATGQTARVLNRRRL